MDNIRESINSNDTLVFGNEKNKFYMIYDPVSGTGGILKFLYNSGDKWLVDFICLSSNDVKCGLDIETLNHHVHVSDRQITVSGYQMCKMNALPITKNINHNSINTPPKFEKTYCDIINI